MEDHWFDRLNKVLVRESPRRSLLGAVAAAISSHGLAALPESALGKKGKKHKRKGKGKNKKDRKKHKKYKTPKQCGADIHFACSAATLTTSPEDCEDKCARCKKAGTAFCLVPTEVDDDALRRPTCCYSADECCGAPIGECCTLGRCCHNPESGSRYCAPPGHFCCRDGGYCPNGQECCGDYCVPCEAPNFLNPNTCECEAPDAWCRRDCVGPGLACCGEGLQVVCVDTRSSNNACGGCDRTCDTSNGERCCNASCEDVRFGNDHCGGNCEPCPVGQECCDYRCVDPQSVECCHSPESSDLYQYCSRNTHHCCIRDGSPACCRNE